MGKPNREIDRLGKPAIEIRDLGEDSLLTFLLLVDFSRWLVFSLPSLNSELKTREMQQRINLKCARGL